MINYSQNFSHLKPHKIYHIDNYYTYSTFIIKIRKVTRISQQYFEENVLAKKVNNFSSNETNDLLTKLLNMWHWCRFPLCPVECVHYLNTESSYNITSLFLSLKSYYKSTEAQET
jgi:hypothetical protein